MEFNLNTNDQEEDSLLKQKQKIGSMRYDLLKSELELTKVIANIEADKLKRKCHDLEESVSRLQQDLKISREREMKDQEKINNLLTKLEMNETEYIEKLVELKMKVFDLECVSETRNLHCQKKSSFTEAGDLPLPSKIGINNSTREASTGQKGSVASLVKKRMFRTLDPISTSPTNENDITAQSAKTTVQKEGPKGSTDLSKHDAPKKTTVQKEGPKNSTDLSKHDASAGQKRSTAILEKKKMSQILGSRSTPTTTNGQSITAFNTRTTVQEGDPKDLTIPSKTSSRPMKRSRTSDTLITRNPIITSCNKVSTRKVQPFYRSDTKDGGKECKGQLATSEQIACALKRAEMLQSNLKSHNPSFIKSMVLSHVSRGFLLHIPSEFRKENLRTADRELAMILEDESGLEYNSKYLSSGAMHGLSGGWRGFALAHNLEIGDALVFELTNPLRFKVHIIKAIQ